MPQLSHQALLTELSGGTLRPVYYLAGEERMRRDAAAAAILKKAAPDPFNLQEYYGDTLNIDELIASASTLPMFSERRVLVVKHAHAMDASARKAVAAYLESPLDSTTLILIFDKRPEKGDALEAAARSAGASLLYKALDHKEAASWVLAKSKAAGRPLSSAAAETLVSEAGTDLAVLSQELEKLTTFAKGLEGEVTPTQVLESLGYRQVEVVFEMGRAIERKDLKRALELVGPLCEAEDTFRVLYQISGAIERQLKARRYLAAGTDPETIYRELKVNKYYNKDFLMLARARRETELLRGLERCLEAEMRLKSSPSASSALELEQLVVEVCR